MSNELLKTKGSTDRFSDFVWQISLICSQNVLNQRAQLEYLCIIYSL